MTAVAEAFGCPRAAQPADFAAYTAYFDEQVRTMEVTDVGRRLAADVLDPTLPLKLHVPLGPALRVQRLVAVGTLPAPLREQFGFRLGRRTAAPPRPGAPRRPPPHRGDAPGRARRARCTPTAACCCAPARKHVAEFDAKQASRAEAAA